MPVERHGGIVRRVDDDGHRGNLSRCVKGPAQGIHQQVFARALAAKTGVDREATYERCRHDGIFR